MLCKKCGAELQDNASKCHICEEVAPCSTEENNSSQKNTNIQNNENDVSIENNDKKYEETDLSLLNNEKKLDKEESILTNNNDSLNNKEEKAQGKKKFPLVTVIRNSVLVMISLIMVILAFCPIFKAEIQEVENFEVKVTAINVISFLFDSFEEYDINELTKSDIYEEMRDISKELYDVDIDDLSKEEEELLNEYGILSIRLSLISNTVPVNIQLIISAIMCLLYLIVSCALFIVASLNLLASFGFIGGLKKLHNATINLISLTPIILLVAFYCVFATYGSGSYSLTGVGAWVIILALFGIVGTGVIRLIFAKDKKTINYIPRGIAAALAVIVVSFAFSPILVTTVEDGSKEKDIDIDISYFTNLNITEDGYETINEMYNFENMTKEDKQEFFEEIVDQIKDLDKESVEGTTGKLLNYQTLLYLHIAKLPTETNTICSLFNLPFILAVAGALIVLWQNAICFAKGTYSKAMVITGKIISAVGAGVAILLIVVYLIVISQVLVYLPKSYSISIGVRIIIFALFAIGSDFCPHKLKLKDKNERVMEKRELVEQF